MDDCGLRRADVGVRVKTVGKISVNTGSVFYIFRSFSYYSVNTVIGTKTGYGVVGNARNMVGLSYCPFLNWVEKSGNFLDFLHCSFSNLISCTCSSI
jgi:hypothetical protein